MSKRIVVVHIGGQTLHAAEDADVLVHEKGWIKAAQLCVGDVVYEGGRVRLVEAIWIEDQQNDGVDGDRPPGALKPSGFSAGTLIGTEHGRKPMEHLNAADDFVFAASFDPERLTSSSCDGSFSYSFRWTGRSEHGDWGGV